MITRGRIQRLVTKVLRTFTNNPKSDGRLPAEREKLFKEDQYLSRRFEGNPHPADPKFLSRVHQIENDYKTSGHQRDWLSYLLNLQFPILLLIGSIFTYFAWSTRPFQKVYQHLTIGEHTIRKHYYHTIITSAISFKDSSQVLAYIPSMAYASLILARNLKTRHFVGLFIANAILTSALTFAYEKYDNGFNNKSMLPKVNGSSTALSFMACLVGFSPLHSFFGIRFLPFVFFPMAFMFYEINEYREVYVKEISRPAHLMALANGLLMGLIFRRILITKRS
jgi:hypothetical protein